MYRNSNTQWFTFAGKLPKALVNLIPSPIFVVEFLYLYDIAVRILVNLSMLISFFYIYKLSNMF